MIIRKGQVLGSVNHAELRALAEKKIKKAAAKKTTAKKTEKTPGDLAVETSKRRTADLEG